MQAIEKIKKEHEQIEQYLKEIEVIMKTNPINYPNLIHTCKEYKSLWDFHEEKEMKIFKILSESDFSIPIQKIDFEHGELKKHHEAITSAINSGSEYKIKEALEDDGKKLIEKLREHISFEDEFIYTVGLDLLKPETIKKLEEFGQE